MPDLRFWFLDPPVIRSRTACGLFSLRNFWWADSLSQYLPDVVLHRLFLQPWDVAPTLRGCHQFRKSIGASKALVAEFNKRILNWAYVYTVAHTHVHRQTCMFVPGWSASKRQGLKCTFLPHPGLNSMRTFRIRPNVFFQFVHVDCHAIWAAANRSCVICFCLLGAPRCRRICPVKSTR